MTRSLRVAPHQIDHAKLALKYSGIGTQRALSTKLQLALSTVSRFFTGKPVDYHTFVKICTCLELQWPEIAQVESLSLVANDSEPATSPITTIPVRNQPSSS